MIAMETILSLVGAAITGAGTTGAVALRIKNSRETKFYERYDKRMVELEHKVAECEKERPIVQILTLGMCMAVPELQRLSLALGERRNPVLDQVANAFKALPQDRGDLNDLLHKLRSVPGVYSAAEEKEQERGAEDQLDS